MSFPMLFVPAFYGDTAATLNNYVPVIIHPMYYAGLVVLSAGIAMPALRLFANTGWNISRLDIFPFAMCVASVVYCVALFTFARGLVSVWGEEPSRTMHESLFWGGGHVLQFLYAILMLSSWAVLARKTLERDIVDPDIFRLAIGLIGVFSLAAILFSVFLDPLSPMYAEVFRRLQFVLAFPSLLIAAGGMLATSRARQIAPLPWRDPAFVALLLSPVVFGVGGVMGLLITGSDTRTPAHYHGVIGGVQVACMGMILCYALPLIAAPARATRQRMQLSLFAFGQLFASIGLFMAGGYGAPRKTPSGAINLADGAAVGMFLHGIGALFAIAGGGLFVWTVFTALVNTTPRWNTGATARKTGRGTFQHLTSGAASSTVSRAKFERFDQNQLRVRTRSVCDSNLIAWTNRSRFCPPHFHPQLKRQSRNDSSQPLSAVLDQNSRAVRRDQRRFVGRAVAHRSSHPYSRRARSFMVATERSTPSRIITRA